MSPHKKIAEDGTKQGQAIPGSRLFRSFCAHCGEAMRTAESVIRGKTYCTDCGGRGYPPPPGCSASFGSDIAYHGGQFHTGEW